MIERYRFGSIVINEREYNSDIILYPDGRIEASWWRKSGHKLIAEDIIALIESRPKVIIAGTGAYGIMEPDKGLAVLLAQRGIDFKALPTPQAVELYNDLYKNTENKGKIGACFHLTC